MSTIEITHFNNIYGWFNFQDIYTEAVETAPKDATIVELGCWLGRSTAFMAELIKKTRPDIKFYVVDTFEGDPDAAEHLQFAKENGGNIYKVFLNNMVSGDLLRFVTPLRLRTDEAFTLFKDNSLHMVFIDAMHSYDAVKLDIAQWYPKVMDGGIFAGHDMDWEGVKKAVLEFQAATQKECLTKNTSWYFRK